MQGQIKIFLTVGMMGYENKEGWAVVAGGERFIYAYFRGVFVTVSHVQKERFDEIRTTTSW